MTEQKRPPGEYPPDRYARQAQEIVDQALTNAMDEEHHFPRKQSLNEQLAERMNGILFEQMPGAFHDDRSRVEFIGYCLAYYEETFRASRGEGKRLDG